jgi:hypothetical protein
VLLEETVDSVSEARRVWSPGEQQRWRSEFSGNVGLRLWENDDRVGAMAT